MIQTKRPLLVGNWKMNRTPSESVAHIDALRNLVEELPLDIVVMPPTLALPAVVAATEGSNLSVGAQDAHFADSGSFTGEVSMAMLRSVGVRHVLIGHSERRRMFHETDHDVNLKVAAALRYDARPIVCVGETREEFESGAGPARVVEQVTAAFNGVTHARAPRVIVGYEPVWAVGTSTTPTADDANEILAHVRDTIAALYDSVIAQRVQLIYGGGLSPENAVEFANQPQIDGALVGAATSTADGFAGIAHALVRP